MTKEEYLFHRNKNNIGDIAYQYYNEGFQADKHKQFLDPESFFMSINMWGNMGIYLPSVLSYYDCKFEIMRIDNKTGQTIRYL